MSGVFAHLLVKLELKNVTDKITETMNRFQLDRHFILFYPEKGNFKDLADQK